MELEVRQRFQAIEAVLQSIADSQKASAALLRNPQVEPHLLHAFEIARARAEGEPV